VAGKVKIIYTPKFARQYKKLPTQLQTKAEKKEAVFRQNPFDPSLKTHQLQGRLKSFWSFSITYKHRIIFEFASKNVVHFHSIGDHSIYA